MSKRRTGITFRISTGAPNKFVQGIVKSKITRNPTPYTARIGSLNASMQGEGFFGDLWKGIKTGARVATGIAGKWAHRIPVLNSVPGLQSGLNYINKRWTPAGFKKIRNNRFYRMAGNGLYSPYYPRRKRRSRRCRK
jgi:hypothetical protein